jgi:hypothetical protein
VKQSAGAGGCRHFPKFVSHAHAYARMGEGFVKCLHPPAPSLSPPLVWSGTKPDTDDPSNSLTRLQEEPRRSVSLLGKLRARQCNFAISLTPRPIICEQRAWSGRQSRIQNALFCQPSSEDVLLLKVMTRGLPDHRSCAQPVSLPVQASIDHPSKNRWPLVPQAILESLIWAGWLMRDWHHA